ncbi:unnamed protein product [Eruca vesicaria subsp. sativa]|uniref:Uncharacterized protein n=1 Tax=Eruca vesicaria subsp. sativa TaxID=29727 RepID=A0ABC8L002_ERUVS|nr:unnamed protein product [Eruca vesicaria subsp. sativa]
MSAAAIVISGMILANQQRRWDQTFEGWICETYPETAHSIQSQKPELRDYYVSVISDIMWKLGHKRTLSDAELTSTSDQLAHLTQAGLKVEWLSSKLERKKREAYLQTKKREACETRILELKQELKKLEIAKSGLKAELKLEKAKLNPRSFRNIWGNCFSCLNT